MAWFFDRANRRFRLRKAHDANADMILDRLRSYLDDMDQPISMLCGFWEDQQKAISYQELRALVESGVVDEVTLHLWQQDYSYLVTEMMPEVWTKAMVAGSVSQPIMESIAPVFTFDIQRPGVTEWVRSRGAYLVTSCTQTQKDAISLLLEDKIRSGYTVDELARLIRPCIGLTRGQTSAARNYYDTILRNLTEQHPRTKPEVLQARALDRTTKYAERLHRQRAMTIAQTEMAYAYNFGADEGIRQAQTDYLIGKCVKRWCTAGDENVCDECRDLDGKEIGMEETFFSGNKVEYDEFGLFPPLHPRCACAVEYIEVEPPALGPDIEKPVEEQSRLQAYNSNEVPLRALDAEGFTGKFRGITGKDAVDSAIYDNAVEILKHRTGTNNEDLVLLDRNTGETIHKLTSSKDAFGVRYDDDTITAIQNAQLEGRKIVAIHNHPNGLPPSLDDGSSALIHGYDFGVVVGHNLEVWTYGKTDRIYSAIECTKLHNALAENYQFMVDFDENLWYDVLRTRGMEVSRK